ncbi:MAG: NAD-dependent epimerase/dehydratase family protein [Planctomycetota bacterium]
MPDAHVPERALVTGGGGFLGGAIVRLLLARGDTVRSVSRGQYPALTALGVDHIRGDLADPATAARAMADIDVVYHVAAKAGVWGAWKEYWRANVVATDAVIAACRAAGVTRLVFTSSPSAVFSGTDCPDGDESLPYPARPLSYYSATKGESERRVLAANGEGLATVALRPHLIMGAGDPHLMPRLLDRARKGKLIQVGNGTNEVSLTWVDDAARAHLLAADCLRTGGHTAACAGKAYFISQGERTSLWGFIAGVLARLDVPPVKRSVSLRTAWVMATLIEGVYRALMLRREPPLTRFVAAQMARHHHYRIDRAKADFGYAPTISVAELADRVVESCR